MISLHIDNKPNEEMGKKGTVEEVVNLIGSTNNIFMFIFMDGCGPCNAMKPEWVKIKSKLTDKYPNRDDVVIISMNMLFLNELESELTKSGKKSIGEIVGFPTIKYIKGNKIDEYTGSRESDIFVSWVAEKIPELKTNGTSVSNTVGGKRTKKCKKINKSKKSRKSKKSKKR